MHIRYQCKFFLAGRLPPSGMANGFIIHYNNKDIRVSTTDNCHFQLQENGVEWWLELKEDDEGANHWFEKGVDNETSRTKEIGLLIEKELKN